VTEPLGNYVTDDSHTAGNSAETSAGCGHEPQPAGTSKVPRRGRRLASLRVSAKDNEDLIPVPSTENRNRIDDVWRALFDVPSLASISPQNRLNILVVEHRLKAERLATARLTRATWVLVAATAVLALATIALVYVTALSR
jgi:hypothetical protein